MNYLCIDYGLKHIGLALATTPLSEPLKTISTVDCVPTLIKIITDHHIDTVIVGLSEGFMAELTRRFAHHLQNQLSIPVVLHDETLSSQQVHLHLSHAHKHTRYGPDHHFAAALILQDYLDHNLVTRT